jgi:hypothetical protein
MCGQALLSGVAISGGGCSMCCSGAVRTMDEHGMVAESFEVQLVRI